MFARRARTLGTIDAHQHLWILSERQYSWITPDFVDLYKDFTQREFLEASASSKIDGTVLIQSADTYEDTFYMLHVASSHSLIKGVVGWIPLDRTQEAIAALEVLRKDPLFKGIRNLTHDYSNPKYESNDRWILRKDVLETLSAIERSGLSFDYVAVNAGHLESITQVATKFPNLRIVIDHFGKPDIAGKVLEPWKGLIEASSLYPNLHMKFSGLNTVSKSDWISSDWKPYFDCIYQSFGPERILMGGDWPVITLMDDYAKVWKAQMEVIGSLTKREQDMIRGGNAARFYRL